MKKLILAAVVVVSSVFVYHEQTTLTKNPDNKKPDDKKPCPGPNCPTPPKPPAPSPSPKKPRRPGPWRACEVSAVVGEVQKGKSVSPKGHPARIQFPSSLWQKNIGSKLDGAGMCVDTSIEHSLRYLLRDDWRGFRDFWASAERGGGWPESVAHQMTEYPGRKGVASVSFIQYNGKNIEVLRLALAAGIPPAITYNGHDANYRGSIAHMVCLVSLDTTTDEAAILDNNFTATERMWMSVAEFKQRWYQQGGGWCVVPLEIAPWFPKDTPPLVESEPPEITGEGTVVYDRLFDGVSSWRLYGAGERYELNGVESDETTVLGYLRSLAQWRKEGWFCTVVAPASKLDQLRAEFQSVPNASSYSTWFVAPDSWYAKRLGAKSGVTTVYVRKAGVESKHELTENVGGLLDVFRPKQPKPLIDVQHTLSLSTEVIVVLCGVALLFIVSRI